jgi:hypothetical protein
MRVRATAAVLFLAACGASAPDRSASTGSTTATTDPPTTTTAPAPPPEIGVDWRRVDTGTLFEGAQVTDAAAGPGGYVAVGMTSVDPRRPAAWFSEDGTAWERVPDLGLPPDVVASSFPTSFLGYGAVRERAVVVGASDSGYVAVVKTAPVASDPCADTGYVTRSDDGRRWHLVGTVDHGPRPGGQACGLPDEDGARIPTSGEPWTVILRGDDVVVAGKVRWARAYDTGDTTVAVWLGHLGTAPELVSNDTEPFGASEGSGVEDGAIAGDTIVLSGFGNGVPPRGLVLVSGDGREWERVEPESAVAPDTRIAFVALATLPDGSLVAVGIAHAVAIGSDPELRVWRSADARRWTIEALDGTGVTPADVAAGPWGVVAVGNAGFDGVVFRSIAGGAWERVDAPVAGTVRLVATDWGVLAFTSFAGDSSVLVSGAPPRRG